MGDMLSQEEIDALLKGADSPEAEAPQEEESIGQDAVQSFENEPLPMTDENNSGKEYMSDLERDTLGEIGNISMGTAATTFSTLLNNKVVITTPKVTLTTTDELAKEYPIPSIAVKVEYKEGLLGSNLLVLKEDDVKKIADIMMGGDGTNTSGEVTELHLSAIGEAMNQMIGSSATSLSSMFDKKIDILPPAAFIMDFKTANEHLAELTQESNEIVKVSFKMEVGSIIDSEMMQLLPLEFAKGLVDQVLPSDDMEGGKPTMGNTTMAPMDNSQAFSNNVNQSQAQVPQQPQQQYVQQPQYMQPPQQYVQPQQQYAQPQPQYVPQPQYANPVDVRPAQFQNFESQSFRTGNGESIELIRDVPLEITVELGRTRKTIKEILEFNAGTVIELEKLSGEAVDILVNGKYIAKGEVVVIDENYGIRITEVVKQSNRI